MVESGPPAISILGLSEEARTLRAMIDTVARGDGPVMLLGEPGTGKQLTAQLLHEESPRREAPFLMIDCSLYYERELKRELFGYGPASQVGGPSRKGLLEFAARGTCYLSHIEELTPAIQSALLKFLREGRFRRLGDGRDVASRVRLVVSSEKDLEGFVEAGLFDPELYLALAMVKRCLSPLRDRKEDIPIIVEAMREMLAGKAGRPLPAVFLPDAIGALQAYPWPQNLDELKREVTRLLECGIAQVGVENLAMDIASYWLGQRGDPEVRKVVEELDGYIREFRVLSRLNCEFGGITEVLMAGSAEHRSCYWGSTGEH
jgi:DNA-binding NtrC family response regulator